MKEKDLRNFPLGAITDLPAYDTLPDEFCLEDLPVKDQKDTDFCAAFATCLASEYQEGVRLAPEYNFALAKSISGDVDGFGCDFYTMLKTHTNFGAVRVLDCPHSVEKQDRSFLARLGNYPDELKILAQTHRKKSYFEITGSQIPAYNVMASLWKFRKEKRAIVFGVLWNWPTSQVKMDNIPSSGVGHALTIIGWKRIDGQIYFIIQNSYGKETGENGRHYFSLNVVNYFVGKWGAFMMMDLPRETAENYLNNGIKLDDVWFFKLLKSLWRFIRDLWKWQ